MKNYFLFIVCTFLWCSCTNNTILFEDDFENQSIGKLPGHPWEKTGNGSVVVDTLRAFSGKKSVHFTSGEGYKNRAFIGIDHIFPVQENRFYGRLKMYVEEAPRDGIHWTMIQSSGKVKDHDFSSEIRYGGQHQKRLMANYETQGVKSDCWQHSQTKIPEEKWFTLQWMFDGEKDTMKLWLNNVLIESIIVVGQGEGCVSNEIDGKWKFPVFENMLIGWVDYQTGGGTRSIWIDDVVLSERMISDK
ncbi:hypothetical protein [Aquimarina sp. AU119]|uniref:hypothetical protein n=1 Tax=Aquimarina sp. AU119 TaxID=2108528 RepID=UPI000D69CCD2|nr:hypothetical protein [Aquimarina sp. AU119]